MGAKQNSTVLGTPPRVFSLAEPTSQTAALSRLSLPPQAPAFTASCVVKNASVKNASVKDASVKDESVKDEGVKDESVKDEGVKDESDKD